MEKSLFLNLNRAIQKERFKYELWNEEQRELGLAAFQQPGVVSALVSAIADILLIDIAVAGLQFADKGAFRYPAGTQQPVFTHIVREYRKQQLSQLHYYPNQRSVYPVKQIIIYD